MNRRRSFPLIIAAFLVIGLGVWGILQNRARRQLQINLGNQYQRSFYELVSRVQSIEILLAKSLITNSLSQNVLTLANISREANLAQENLSQLPISQIPMIQTLKFLNQTSDLAYSAAKRAAKGMPVSEKDWKDLETLHAQAGRIGQSLNAMQRDVADGSFEWSKLRNVQGSKTQANPIRDGFMSMEEQIEEEGPTLIYDGPFSDHVMEREPLGVTGEDVTAEEAENIVKRFVGPKDWDNFEIVNFGKAGDKVPSYQFQIRPKGQKKDEIIDIDITKKGGHVIWMINTRDIGDKNVSVAEALQKAAEFLKTRGYESMVPSYTAQQGDVIVANYVYKWNDIIVYPDLISMEIAQDNGEVVSFDAQSYLGAHRTRELRPPELSEEEALKLISHRLKVEDVRLALIPLETFEEILTYEIKGEFSGDKFLIYINAYTGDEERILHVIDTPEGAMIM